MGRKIDVYENLPLKVAKEWLKKANSKKTYPESEDRENVDENALMEHYEKFIYVYIAFNALYSAFEKSEKWESENKCITNYLAYLYSIEDFRKQIKPILDSQRNKIKNKKYKIARGKNSNSTKIRLQINILEVFNDEINDLGLLCAIVLNCYRIRCNLFHGTKDFINEDWEYINEALVLKEFVEIMIKIEDKGYPRSNRIERTQLYCVRKKGQKLKLINISQNKNFIKNLQNEYKEENDNNIKKNNQEKEENKFQLGILYEDLSYEIIWFPKCFKNKINSLLDDQFRTNKKIINLK